MNAIILAAGRGKRMKAKIPKVLLPLLGRPLIKYVLETARLAGSTKNFVIINKDTGDLIISGLDGEDIEYVYQNEPKGTADAVSKAIDKVNAEEVLILCGDAPLIENETIKSLIYWHRKNNAAATVLSAKVKDPYGYGRIVRNAGGEVEGIVEEKDANREERLIDEINSGTYIFDVASLKEVLDEIKPSPVTHEYYLTDSIKILAKMGKRVQAVRSKNAEEVVGVNSRRDLAMVEKILRIRVFNRLMDEGVLILDSINVHIDYEAKIGEGTVIKPFTYIEGPSVVGKNCEIGPFAYIKNKTIEDNTVLEGNILKK